MADRDHDRSLLTRVHDCGTALRRAMLRRRRLIAVVCTAGAVAAGLRATAPPQPPTAVVLVAARDLPAGATLRADDVRPQEVAPAAVPAGALTDAVHLTGTILASPLRAGEPVTDVRLVGPALAAADPGTVAAPVRLSDAAQAGLLDVGDEIDLLATDPEARTTVAVVTGAVVLAVPEVRTDAPDALTGRLIVLGVPSSAVGEVTGAAVTSFVTYAWSSR